jgi:hypothetical protein
MARHSFVAMLSELIVRVTMLLLVFSLVAHCFLHRSNALNILGRSYICLLLENLETSIRTGTYRILNESVWLYAHAMSSTSGTNSSSLLPIHEQNISYHPKHLTSSKPYVMVIFPLSLFIEIIGGMSHLCHGFTHPSLANTHLVKLAKYLQTSHYMTGIEWHLISSGFTCANQL